MTHDLKVLRYDSCVTRDHTVLPATHTQQYLPLLSSRKASPPCRYQLILLGEQRHIGVINLPTEVITHIMIQELTGLLFSCQMHNNANIFSRVMLSNPPYWKDVK